MPTSSLRRSLAVAALVWIASVPVAELAFRALGVDVAATVQGVYQSFGDAGYRLRPDADVLHTWASGDFSVRTDALGLRIGADGRGATEPGQSVDIAVLGDSQAFGQGLEFEDTVVGVLQGHAEAAGLRVANTSVGGHFLQDQLDVLEHLVAEDGVRVRNVLVLLTPRAVNTAGERSDAVVVEGNLYTEAPTLTQEVRAWVSRNSAVWIVLRDATREDDARSASRFLALYESRRDDDPRVASLQEWLDALVASPACEGARVVVAYTPPEVEVRVPAIAESAGVDDIDQNAPLEMAQLVAERASCPFIDTSPALEDIRSAGTAVTLDGDPHYGKETSAAVGDLLWTSYEWRAEDD